MKIIKLTSISTNDAIYLNADHVGHFYRVKKDIHRQKFCDEHTVIDVTTHNNGGFRVIETPEQILKMIKEFK